MYSWPNLKSQHKDTESVLQLSVLHNSKYGELGSFLSPAPQLSTPTFPSPQLSNPWEEV